MDLRESCAGVLFESLPLAEAEAVAETLPADLIDVTDGETCLASNSAASQRLQRMVLLPSLDTKNGSGVLEWKPETDLQKVEKLVGKTKQRMMKAMLNDTFRNDAYDRAITRVVQTFKQEKNRNPLVLDIGTGTGLLAMFAARQGMTTKDEFCGFSE